MFGMVSTPSARRVRKQPAERRAEIVDEAARIALESGLERITLRAVADRLGVRPGLITHYYPAADDLVIAAFVRAVARERDELVPIGGTPMNRLARMVAYAESEDARGISRLWLNARHLCRFNPALVEALQDQEALDRARLTSLIMEGTDDGTFAPDEPFAACIRILIAIDGMWAYANNTGTFSHEAYSRFVTDTTEWALRLPPGTVRAAVSALGERGASGSPSDAS